jgi:hypothetical protein
MIYLTAWIVFLLVDCYFWGKLTYDELEQGGTIGFVIRYVPGSGIFAYLRKFIK